MVPGTVPANAVAGGVGVGGGASTGGGSTGLFSGVTGMFGGGAGGGRRLPLGSTAGPNSRSLDGGYLPGKSF